MSEVVRLSAPYLMVFPALVMVTLFIYLPMGITAVLSLFDWTFISAGIRYVGFEQYRKLFQDPNLRAVVGNTFAYIVVLVPAQIVFPLFLAKLLVRLKPGITTNIYRSVLFIPTILSFSIAAVAWLWLFNPIVGLLNQLLESAHLRPQRWLNDPDLAIWCVALVAFWKSLGLNMLLFVSALIGVPPELLESAKIDGASRWQTFIRIELPLISPTIFYVAVTTLFIVLDEIVNAVDVLTEGGPFGRTSNALYFLYEKAFRFFQLGEASALAVVVMCVVLLMTWVQFRAFEKYVHYR
jgi:ABC-type sugar transport system permease subunit